jgi:hypothetical protein
MIQHPTPGLNNDLFNYADTHLLYQDMIQDIIAGATMLKFLTILTGTLTNLKKAKFSHK